MVRGDQQHVRVAQDLLGLERPLERRQHRERELELAALDEPEQVVVGRRLAQLELDVRPGGEEAPHHLREHLRADTLERPDAERAAVTLREGGHVGLRGVETRDDRLGVAEQQRPGLRERDRPWTARTLEQPLPDESLQGLDLLADRRLRVAERHGSPAERALAGDGFQGCEMTELDAEPTIRFHDRYRE